MPASGPRSRGARVHPRSCQGCQPWPRASAASGLVLATQKLGGITGRGTSASSSNTCRLLARDHAAPESTLALAKAGSLGSERVRPLAWCSRPRSSTASMEGALVARIADSSVEAVKATADIVEVISGRTQLRRSGARFTGLCPFHDERTPSFSVSPEKGLYYCFGCGAAGDAVSFVEETEGVDFVGAIEWLAQRFNVPLEYEQASPEQDARRRRRDRLHAVLDAAASFYERYLWESQAGADARAYLESRGLGEDVCREYRLGLAARGATLARKAAERGFTQQELTGAGLVNRRGNDYFQGRLLFPIADARGRAVGFQARKLREDDPLQAKYVN